MVKRLWVAVGLLATSGFSQTGRAQTLSATFLGGTLEDTCRDVAVDDQGNIYATGGTESPGFPTTDGTTLNPGANGAQSGPHDAWVARFAPDGTLVWATLVGGPAYDRAYAVEVNQTGVYIAGRAGAGFPTTNGVVQPTFAGDSLVEPFYGPQDGFVVKLTPAGAVVWATYLGGAGRDIIRDFDVDATGAVVAGVISSAVNPHVTPGAYDTTPGTGLNAVVVKLAVDAQSVVWGTYLGGTGDDGVNPSVRVDPASGVVYVLASANSTDFPTTAGAHQATNRGGSDLTLTALAANGASLVFSTYLGGGGDDFVETHGLAVRGNLLAIAGGTNSTNLSTSPGAVQPGSGGGNEALLAVFETNGTFRALSYLGGAQGDAAEGVGFLADGRVVVAGLSLSSAFPTGAVLQGPRGGQDGFLAVLPVDLSRVDLASRAGGGAEDALRTLATNSAGTVVAVGGLTHSPDFPVTNGSTYRSTGSQFDARDAVVGWFTLPPQADGGVPLDAGMGNSSSAAPASSSANGPSSAATSAGNSGSSAAVTLPATSGTLSGGTTVGSSTGSSLAGGASGSAGGGESPAGCGACTAVGAQGPLGLGLGLVALRFAVRRRRAARAA